MDSKRDDETYVLSGSGMPQSRRGWIILAIIVIALVVAGALGVRP